MGAYDWLKRAPKQMGCARVVVGQGRILCQEPGRAFWYPVGEVTVLCDEHALTGLVELSLEEYEVWMVMDS